MTIRTAPIRHGLAGLSALITVLVLLGAALWQAAPSSTVSNPPLQAFDAEHQRMYRAQPDGSVRVLSVRNGISELGVLRAPDRKHIAALRLDAAGNAVWVQGDDALYRYDLHSLSLQERKTTPQIGATEGTPGS